jgi:methylmalonyl-CoA mutase N-terminal domain/subunit
MTLIKFCQPDRSVNILTRMPDATSTNQGFISKCGQAFSLRFQVRTDFRVHIISDRVLRRLWATYLWDIVPRHWGIVVGRFETAFCSLLQESKVQ